MATPIEREPVPKPPEGVKEYIETPEIPERIEKGGVSVRQGNFQVQISDDNGQPLIQTPRSQKITILLPKPQENLEKLSKGSTDDAITWFAAFWKRVIKRALFFGWIIKDSKEK